MSQDLERGPAVPDGLEGSATGTPVAALLLDDEPDSPTRETPRGETIVGGLSLVERAALAAQRSGVSRIHIVGGCTPDSTIVQRLRACGLTVTRACLREQPFKAAPEAGVLVVIPVGVVFEPRAVTALLEQARLQPGEVALAIDGRPEAGHRFVDVSNGSVRSLLADGNAASTGLAIFTREALAAVRNVRSARAALWQLARAGKLRAVDTAPHFCRRLRSAALAARLERDYIRHLNGGERESYFTKEIRRFSVPITRRLVRRPITPNQVTMASFVLSLVAGALFGVGAYWAGLVGAMLYYASSVLDCCDGEVARTKFCESAFGCWLETATDYASYVFVWIGITVAALRTDLHGVYARTAMIALAATLLLFGLVAYYRHRVARTDPGQFDDAWGETSARHRGRFYRFAGWARQWIKRSTLAHLLLVLALIGQLSVLLFAWAIGASLALVGGLALFRFMANDVTVSRAGQRPAPMVTRHA